MVESIQTTDLSDNKDHNSSSPEVDESFRIHSKKSILHILQEIMRKNTTITLYFDQSKRFILTSMLAIDNDRNELLVDYGAKQEFNALALKSTNLSFITSQNGIKIEFASNQIRTTQYENRSVFAVKLPDSLIRMQRRSSYRVPIPVSTPLQCVFSVPTKDVPVKAEIEIRDISCSGISVNNQHPAVILEPGTTYHNCQIDFPGFGTLTVTIKVISSHETTLKNGQVYKWAGCQFLNLQSKAEAMIQRYIIKQEQTRITN